MEIIILLQFHTFPEPPLLGVSERDEEKKNSFLCLGLSLRPCNKFGKAMLATSGWSQRFHVRPALLDGVFQLARFVENGFGTTQNFIPSQICHATFFLDTQRSSPTDSTWATAKVLKSSEFEILVDIYLFNNDDSLIFICARGCAEGSPLPDTRTKSDSCLGSFLCSGD
jgi:hypothetical protein